MGDSIAHVSEEYSHLSVYKSWMEVWCFHTGYDTLGIFLDKPWLLEANSNVNPALPMSTLGIAVRPAVLNWIIADLPQLEICDEQEWGRHSWKARLQVYPSCFYILKSPGSHVALSETEFGFQRNSSLTSIIKKHLSVFIFLSENSKGNPAYNPCQHFLKSSSPFSHSRVHPFSFSVPHPWTGISFLCPTAFFPFLPSKLFPKTFRLCAPPPLTPSFVICGTC